MKKVLICEDEHILSLDIKRHLVRFGYEVAGAYSSAEDAIEACSRDEVDLVLMDIRLRGPMDGIEAARRIYDQFDIPVIMLTAYADDEIVARAQESRPFGYIIKPFEERDLKTTIALALYRHGMDRRLRESEERYRALFDEAPSANFTADAAGMITKANAAFLGLFAFPSEEEARSSSIVDRFSDLDEGRRFLERALRGGIREAEEFQLLRLNGEKLSALATVSAAPGPNGAGAELRGFLVDMTARRELEGQLRQAQKMEAVGRLAGGVAHDFNNIITAIMGYCNLLAEDIGADHALKEEVDGIMNAARKAANLTRQLLDFSRRHPMETRIVDINERLVDMEKMLRRLLDENVAIKIFAEAHRPFVSIDPGQFEQIIMNLAVNAKDAMPSGGSLSIETVNYADMAAKPRHGLPAGDWALVIVRDTGSGIGAEDLQRIFEPFFTTKGADRGTGLGLSTVYSIVTQSGGRIAVESEPGSGSTFYVYLPVAEGAERVTAEAAPSAILEFRGDVLLVEDDDYLRSLLARILSKSGFRVLEAANPGEAILIAEQEADFLLITDVVMPHMSGYELAARLAERSPSLRALFMSGYPEKRFDGERSILSAQGFIQKPFTQEQLFQALNDLN